MKNVLKNYRSSIYLIISIIIGTIIGLVFKEKTTIIKPLGNIYINMLTCIIVPLIFFNITVSIANINKPKRIRKLLIITFLVFIVTSIISALLGIFVSNITPFVKGTEIISTSINPEKINFLEKFTNILTVSNFNDLLSSNNMIALLLASIIFGLALNKTKETKVLELFKSINNIIIKIIDIIMLYAPIGIGSYFAVLVGNFGGNITSGYLKMFIIYLLLSLFMYFIVYGIYAYITDPKEGLKRYFKNIIVPSLTALSTCSSAASIPSNSLAASKMDIDDDVTWTVIPLGTNFHKDGSIIGSTFKIMFLVYLFNLDIPFTKILLISLFATLLVSSLPIGGGTISEMFIISLLGLPLTALPILTIIATIIDAPATVLNVVGNTSSSLLVNYFMRKRKKDS